MEIIFSKIIKRSGPAKTLQFVILIFAAAVCSYAAPPNDNFANAQTIIGIGGTVNGTNIGATKQTNEPNHANNFGGASVWYQFTAPGNGVLKLEANGFDSLLGVYTGQSISGLTRIAESDYTVSSGMGSVYASVTIGTRTGVTYYIAVDGKNKYDFTGADTDQFELMYSFLNSDVNDNFASARWLPDGGGPTHWTTTSNIGASKEPGEPNHLNNAGGKSVWFRYNNSSDYARQVEFTLSTSGGSAGNQVAGLFAIYTGSSVNTLTPVLAQSQSSFYSNQRFTLLAQPNSLYYIAIDGFDSGQGADSGTFTLTHGTAKDTRTADFDKDGYADMTVFRPTSGTWYSFDSGVHEMRALQWGANGDKPLIQKGPAGESFYNIFRPDIGNWYITANASQASIFNFGMSGDIPQMRIYRNPSGTHYSRPSIFRPTTGTWWVRDPQGGGTPIQFGQLGDIPVSADFDGDGNDEFTVFRPSNGTWYFFNQAANQYRTVQFGLAGDKPVAADYDGDGIADIAVFRPSNGTWYSLRSRDGGFQAVKFGTAGDVPQPADFDNDGRADFAVFRTGTWWILQSGNNNLSAVAANWGLSTDVPVAAPMN